MLKKSLKYLLLACANAFVLFVLLLLKTDEIEFTYAKLQLVLECFKIFLCFNLTLLALRVLVSVFRKRKLYDPLTKMKWAMILTFSLSAFLYVPYLAKTVDHLVVNRKLRRDLARKITPYSYLAYGYQADQLTLKEYQIIADLEGFKELPDQATNISFSYSYDGFLPDYGLEISYDLPADVQVKSFDYHSPDEYRHQSVTIKGGSQHVRYEEGEM
jgi:hypothetical protein